MDLFLTWLATGAREELNYVDRRLRILCLMKDSEPVLQPTLTLDFLQVIVS